MRIKAFPCPATSEGSNTLSTAVLRKSFDTQQSTQSRYEMCEMSGLAHVAAINLEYRRTKKGPRMAPQ